MDIINILLYVWIILLIMIIYMNFKNENNEKKKEGFTPKIRSYYNPHVRNLRRMSETFINSYNENYFIKKLKNMGIY